MTPTQIRKVVELYPHRSVYQIARELRVKPRDVKALVLFIRDEGYDLPLKIEHGRFKQIVDEALEGILKKIYE